MVKSNEHCLFCKLVSGEIPCFKIWEDKDHIAFLDIFPNTRGMTLVIPKKHFDSYAFSMPDKDYSSLMLASQKVAKLLEKKIPVKRVALVMEGMGINHAHIKLYPMHGLKDQYAEMINIDRQFFDKYDGHISTVLGPEADKKELEKLAKLIRGK